MFEREERIDVLMNEAAIMVAVWNIQVNFSLENPEIPFELIGVKISQADLIEAIGRMGHAAFERACNRLSDLGRLHRERANPKDVYSYHVSRAAIGLMLVDLSAWGTPMVRTDEHDRIVDIKMIEPDNLKAAGKALDDFFGFNGDTDEKNPK